MRRSFVGVLGRVRRGGAVFFLAVDLVDLMIWRSAFSKGAFTMSSSSPSSMSRDPGVIEPTPVRMRRVSLWSSRALNRVMDKAKASGMVGS